MESKTREGRLAAAFVELADPLAVDDNEGAMLQRLADTCASVLQTSTAVRLLPSLTGDPGLVAHSGTAARLIDLAQLRPVSGPTARTLESGQPASVAQLGDLGAESTEFREVALAAGIRSIHAFPLCSRGSLIGALTLLREEPGELMPETSSIAQALADAAAIGIAHERARRESDLTQQRLQHALSSRVVIEQAKGVIAQKHGVDMLTAFNVLREYARRNNRGLSDVAEHVVSRQLHI